jgi:hypothetical protein
VVVDAVWCPAVLKELKMELNITMNALAMTVKAVPYAFPAKGKDLKGYTLTLNGVPAEVKRTSGGKFPEYVYVKVDGKAYYMPKNVVPDAGSDVGVGKTPKVAAEPKVEAPYSGPISGLDADAPEAPKVKKVRRAK